MSFILDALKKSEVERQRQSVPGLMDTGPAPKRARFPLWAIALTALLGVNLAVLIVVLARGGWAGSPGQTHDLRAAASVSPAPAAAPTFATVQPADSSPPEHHFSPMEAPAPVYAPEIPAVAEPSAAAAGGVPAHASRASPPESSAAGGRAREPLLTSGGDSSDQEVLPTISELDLTGANALPDMHLDVHVYATRPAERFVYINMHKYREGATLAEGPVLERIRRDGVVLDYHGLRFVLPRQ